MKIKNFKDSKKEFFTHIILPIVFVFILLSVAIGVVLWNESHYAKSVPEPEMSYEDLIEATKNSKCYDVYYFITTKASQELSDNLDACIQVNNEPVEIISDNKETYIYYEDFNDADDFTRYNKAYKCTIERQEDRFNVDYEIYRANTNNEIIDEEPCNTYSRTVQLKNPIIFEFVNE